MPGLFSSMARGARYAGQGVRSAYTMGGMRGVAGIGMIAGGGAALGGAMGMSSGAQYGFLGGMVPGGESPLEKAGDWGVAGGKAGLGLGGLAGAIGGAMLARRYFGRGMTRPFNPIKALKP